MSGGVDSSVAAALLAADGHDVVGVTMKLWGGDSDTGCCSVSDVDDARRVAQQIGIDHVVFNFGDDFDRHVVQPYVSDHVEGRTPNPCIECNRHLKFDRLLRRAEVLGFDAVATGHHARIVADSVHARRRLCRGADRAKDQSYVVHVLDQAALAGVLFPVGHLTKAAVRAHAAALGLRTAAKPDSQDVCFITKKGRAHFLGARIPLHAGTVVHRDGREVATVDAVELVTVGQRKGLGLPGGGDAYYAVDVDRTRGVVTIGPADELLDDEVALRSTTWTDRPVAGHVLVQTSAHGVPRAGVIDGDVVRWDRPERRVAAGQSVVLYALDDDTVLGGGVAR